MLVSVSIDLNYYALRIIRIKTTASGVRRAKAAFFQKVRVPPGDFAPAGSNRSRYGGNEITEAFDVADHFRWSSECAGRNASEQ